MSRRMYFCRRYFYRGKPFSKTNLREKPHQKAKLPSNATKLDSGNSHRVPNASLVSGETNIEQLSVNPQNGQLLGAKKDKSVINVKPPRLNYDLARVLYQPLALHQLQDSRTGVYNFEPDLEMISPDMVKPKDSDEIPFLSPHRDQTLYRLARKLKNGYVSSTSSMTSPLSQLHFLLSGFRPLNVVDLPISRRFPEKHLTYTQGAKLPASFILRKLDDRILSIDSDKSLDREIVLSVLGHSLEDFLANRQQGQPNSYHYSQINSFLLRSQLDAYDSKLPGTGIFDLKTRAVAAIRHDLSFVENNNNYTGYEIDRVFGEFESLEREFFELIRSTLLKYSLQARIGKMDGIFVAYHNITRMFGFQYLPLEDLDFIIHSCCDRTFRAALMSKDRDFKSIYGDHIFITQHQRDARKIASLVADKEFKLSVHIFKNVLNHLKNLLNSKNIKNWKKCKIMMQTDLVKDKDFSKPLRRPIKTPILRVVAVPLPDDYEDKPLLTKDMNNDTISSQLQRIREENCRRLKDLGGSIVGFEIKVSHDYKKIKRQTFEVPNFVHESQDISAPVSSDYVPKLNRNYYRASKSFRYPNFFDPKDVADWKVHTYIYNINDTKKLKKLYQGFLNQKLKVLEEQSVVISSNPVTSKEVFQRIVDLISEDTNVKDKRKKSQTTSDLKSRLRAYAKKGETRRKLKDRLYPSNVKLTWDTPNID